MAGRSRAHRGVQRSRAVAADPAAGARALALAQAWARALAVPVGQRRAYRPGAARRTVHSAAAPLAARPTAGRPASRSGAAASSSKTPRRRCHFPQPKPGAPHRNPGHASGGVRRTVPRPKRRSADELDVLGLRAFLTLGDFELDTLAVIQRFVALHLDCGEVDEHVLTSVNRDEAVALFGVEPFDGALCHCALPYLVLHRLHGAKSGSTDP